MNRAVQGDVVAVEIFPEAQWKAPADEVVDQESASPEDTVFFTHFMLCVISDVEK